MAYSRFIQIALLLTNAIHAGAANGQPADHVSETARIGKKLQADWRSCVDMAVRLGVAQYTGFVGPAENAFQSCSTEEQLFTAYISGAAPGASPTILVTHYRDKLALKKRIDDDHFKEMAKQIGRQ